MYDAIIVGARCAGASTALLLARKGHEVLLLDRDSFPSDMAASTHMVWQGGVARLRDWGLLDTLVQSNCPPMRRINLDLGEFSLHGHAPPAGDVRENYAPRRYVLDSILVEAAVEAGAELRESCSVSELLTEGDRVTGVRLSDANGASLDEKARIVIGADGMNSMIARAVGAQAVNEHPHLQGTFYAYFSDLPLDDMEFFSRPGRMIYAWLTNDDMTVAGICCRYEDFRELRKDPEASFYSELAALAPGFCERARAARRETNWLKGSTRNFCRQASGPGWALVGDAGLTMDPITAAGISNSFRDAEYLAEAVHEGLSGARPLEEALAGFEERRNIASLPLYGFTCEMARLEPPPQEMIDLFLALCGNQADTDAYFGIFAQSVSVESFFAPENVSRILAAARSESMA